MQEPVDTKDLCVGHWAVVLTALREGVVEVLSLVAQLPALVLVLAQWFQPRGHFWLLRQIASRRNLNLLHHFSTRYTMDRGAYNLPNSEPITKTWMLERCKSCKWRIHTVFELRGYLGCTKRCQFRRQRVYIHGYLQGVLLFIIMMVMYSAMTGSTRMVGTHLTEDLVLHTCIRTVSSLRKFILDSLLKQRSERSQICSIQPYLKHSCAFSTDCQTKGHNEGRR